MNEFVFFIVIIVIVGGGVSGASSGELALSIDERISLARASSSSSSSALNGSDVVVLDGDMVVGRSQFSLRFQENRGLAGGIIKGDRYRWPNAVIPYRFSRDFRSSHKLLVRKAMSEWRDRTCIKFIQSGDLAEKLAGHYHTVKFINADGCWARVGYEYGSTCSLQINGCMHHEVVLHELGHVIGLFHEQSRIDREDFVKIIFDNIEAKRGDQFAIDLETETMGVAYDYCSIMHYGVNYFAKKYFTILPRDLDYTWTIGRMKNLSFRDAKAVNMMYNCNAKCDAQPDCKEPCYVNHKCQCECEEKPCEKHPCRERSSASICRLAQSYLKN